MKPFIKYPATAFLLLLVGYGQLCAQLYREMPPVRVGKNADHMAAVTAKKSACEDIIIEEESEEDERFSCKKYLKGAQYFPIYQVYTPPTAQHSIQESPPSGRYFIDDSTDQYLILQVFRI